MKVRTTKLILDRERILSYGMDELKKITTLTKLELLQGQAWLTALGVHNLSSVLLILLERENPMKLEDLDASYGVEDLPRIVNAITDLVIGPAPYEVHYEKYGKPRVNRFYDEDSAWTFAEEVGAEVSDRGVPDPLRTPVSGLSAASTSA